MKMLALVSLLLSAAPPSGLELAVLSVSYDERGPVVELELRNNSNETLVYYGEGEHPWMEYETETGTVGWLREQLSRCGTGAGEHKLAPGQALRFSTGVWNRNRLRRVRVGVRSRTKDYIVWTPAIDLAILRAGTKSTRR